jgi:hypothetical protein
MAKMYTKIEMGKNKGKKYGLRLNIDLEKREKVYIFGGGGGHHTN